MIESIFEVIFEVLFNFTKRFGLSGSDCMILITLITAVFAVKAKYPVLAAITGIALGASIIIFFLVGQDLKDKIKFIWLITFLAVAGIYTIHSCITYITEKQHNEDDNL